MKTQNLSPPKEHPDEEHSNKDQGDPVETGDKGDCQEEDLVVLGFDFEKTLSIIKRHDGSQGRVQSHGGNRNRVWVCKLQRNLQIYFL